MRCGHQCSDQGTGRDAGLRLFLKAVRLIVLPHAQLCAWSQARHVRHLRWCSSAEQPQCLQLGSLVASRLGLQPFIHTSAGLLQGKVATAMAA